MKTLLADITHEIKQMFIVNFYDAEAKLITINYFALPSVGKYVKAHCTLLLA